MSTCPHLTGGFVPVELPFPFSGSASSLHAQLLFEAIGPLRAPDRAGGGGGANSLRLKELQAEMETSSRQQQGSSAGSTLHW